MEFYPEKKEIDLSEKSLNKLDSFVLEFVGLLKKYVIVSGYVSILLGRSRATEDVDLLMPPLDEEEFSELWKNTKKRNFECINTSCEKEAFDMLKEHAIRFFKKTPVPNIEFKIIKNDLDKYSFENRIKIILKNGHLYVSPLEMQIAYKLFLGSEKDLEDAKHIYDLFKYKINKEELAYFINKLKVNPGFLRIEDG